MKRAEEAALKAYPDKEMNGVALLFGEQRRLFQEGYEQAEKDMKERFINFVHGHYPINYIGWIQDFQKAMEDEK